MRKWLEKPYHSLDYMLQDRFKEKVYKITLNGGMSLSLIHICLFH